MIPIDKLKAVKKIYSHENCPDGISSALLCHDALPAAEVVFVQHGTLAFKNLVAEPGLLFVDCVPPPSRVQEFLDAGSLVLDHHSGSRSITEAFGDNGVYADVVTEPGVSGALLVYRHVWLPIKQLGSSEYAFGFATLAGIRDTWQRGDSQWRAACCQAEALRFWSWEKWAAIKDPFAAGHNELTAMLAIGEPLLSKHEVSVQKRIDSSWRYTTVKGTKLCVFSGLSYTSDAAELLDQEVDIVVGFDFFYEPDPKAVPHTTGALGHKMVCSSRSHTGYDVSALARRFGGNGHKAAAGFSQRFNWIAAPNPYGYLKDMIDAHESGGDFVLTTGPYGSEGKGTK